MNMDSSAYFRTTSLLLLLLGGLQALEFYRGGKDLDFILQNVNHISFPATTSLLTVFGEAAFPIVATRTGAGEDTYKPLIAGGRYGAGKIIGCGHDGLVRNENTLVPHDKNIFLLNAFNWLSQNGHAHHIASLRSVPKSLIEFLNGNGIDLVVLDPETVKDAANITKYDIVISLTHFGNDMADILNKYVFNGGGLLLSHTAWTYYCVENKFGKDYPPNRVAGNAGFHISDSPNFAYSTAQGTFNTSREYLKYTHLLDVTALLEECCTRNFACESERGVIVQQSFNIFTAFLETRDKLDIWETQKNFYRKVLKLFRLRQPVPSLANKVTNPKERLILRVFHLFSEIIKPEDMLVHPASKLFPGELDQTLTAPLPSYLINKEIHYIPINVTKAEKTPSRHKNYGPKPYADVRRGQLRERLLNGDALTSQENNIPIRSVPRWYSTGLWAPAGSMMSVQAIDVDGILDKYDIQIGSHTDDLSTRNEYVRLPLVTSRHRLVNNSVEIVSPYGGLVYVVPEDNANPKNFTLRVQGAELAPYFKIGETSVKKWKTEIRHRRAPWTEFAARGIIFTVPTSDARKIEDPTDVLVFWDRVMDDISDLAGISRVSPERIVLDVDISVGYMHSGYPIMGFNDSETVQLSININDIRKGGSWAHFHELGHNHQRSEWTFSGTGETTCNIFTLYIFTKTLGKNLEETRPYFKPEETRKIIQKYIDTGKPFDSWKKDAVISLLFYFQIMKEHNWQTYKNVFRKYEQLEKDEKPTNDQEKIDLWMIMLSREVKQSLVKFFLSWNFPLSDNAKSAVTNLPESPMRIEDLLI